MVSDSRMNRTDVSRSVLVRRARKLELLTIGWNSLEAIVAVGAGLLARSVALLGFGFDSVIELASCIALMWRLSLDADAERRERIEAKTLKIVGMTFLALAGYVAIDAIKSLLTHDIAATSYSGIALASLSLIVMPLLARAKRRIAARIRSAALHADSRQTDICAYLSAILLGGLLLNTAFGWWWADPIAALVMTPIIVREGIEALRGETCCDDESH